MAANTNRTVIAIGVVAVGGFLAYKLWPSIAKKLKGNAGGGGAGGAAGASSYAPYNPNYQYNPQSGQRPTFEANMGSAPMSKTMQNNNALANSPAERAYQSQWVGQQINADNQALNAQNAANASALATVYQGYGANLDTQAANESSSILADMGTPDTASKLAEFAQSGSTGTFGDWLNSLVSPSNSAANTGMPDGGLIPLQALQEFDLSQETQSVNNADNMASTYGNSGGENYDNGYGGYSNSGGNSGGDSNPGGGSDLGGNSGGGNSGS